MPYHHPAELANRVAMLDHLAQGRLNFGVAASGLPSDWAMFNVDGMSGQNREMTREALDIILRLWSDEPEFDYKGKYWHVTKTGTMFDTLRPHIMPFQKPHPPIGVAGLSKGSDTLKLAGERGFWPMSLNLNPAYVASHWESVEEGAARSGRTPKRSDWRMVREVFVADTDAEALRLSAGGMMGRMMTRVLPAAAGRLRLHRVPEARSRRAGLRRDARVLRQAQLADRLAGHGVGQAPRDLRGGGRLRHAAACSASTTRENPKAWRHSMELLAKEVMPPLQGPGAEVAVDTGSLRPTVVEVSLARLTENFRAIQAAVGAGRRDADRQGQCLRAWPGRGRAPSRLRSARRPLGIAFLEEAVAPPPGRRHRAHPGHGRHHRQSDPACSSRHGLTLTASSIDKLGDIEAIARDMGVTAKVHLKIDTGMERIGVH